jgi:hypothetical protein
LALTALSDALVADRVEHAAVDVDEVAWGYPFPTLDQRCEYLRACCESHRRMGHRTLLVSEVIESAGHLRDVRDAIGADDREPPSVDLSTHVVHNSTLGVRSTTGRRNCEASGLLLLEPPRSKGS